MELTSLKEKGQLPIDFGSSILIRYDIKTPTIIRAIITGPADTPYDSGCLVFDIYIKPEYPKEPPYVSFVNNGHERFNPNLYECGKVCLSLLGTLYVGPDPVESEKWNEDLSTLLQVLISIQSQILVDHPFYNEPGDEELIGSSVGMLRSKLYNSRVRLYTMKYCMLDLLEHPKMYDNYEDFIKTHFQLKKDYILKICDNWVDDINKLIKNINTELSILPPEEIKSEKAELKELIKEYNITFNKLKILLNKF